MTTQSDSEFLTKHTQNQKCTINGYDGEHTVYGWDWELRKVKVRISAESVWIPSDKIELIE
jgi:hypothetical protein